MNSNGVHTYLTKQSLQRVVLDATMVDKVKTNGKPVKDEKKVLIQVIDFSNYNK